ncbi:amino acid racemase [Rapidithrix thailandica]|uniref:Amino acid racemase n=1 Tax=Rapidithrix thailandica TaxID=413964 RepID=A0AAW9SGP7_9BACT
MKKKKIGIIGGMGSRAGMLLFQYIIDKSPVLCDQDFLEVLLHSNTCIPDRTRAILYQEASPVPELQRSVKLLSEQSVDYLISACVTSYHFYSEMQKVTQTQILNIVQMTVNHILNLYGPHCTAGILATSGTIATGLFQQALSKANINYLTLPPDMQENDFMKSVYMNHGLKSATISHKAREHFKACLDYMQERGTEIIIGGCTDVSAIVPEYRETYPVIDVLDTAATEIVRLGYRSEVMTL